MAEGVARFELADLGYYRGGNLSCSFGPGGVEGLVYRHLHGNEAVQSTLGFRVELDSGQVCLSSGFIHFGLRKPVS